MYVNYTYEERLLMGILFLALLFFVFCAGSIAICLVIASTKTSDIDQIYMDDYIERCEERIKLLVILGLRKVLRIVIM